MIRDLSLNPWWAEGELLRSRTTIDKIIVDSARLGFDGIDMQEIYLGLSPHPDPELIYQLQNSTKAAGLSIISSWFRTDLFAAARLYSEDRVVGHLRRYLHIASSLSSRYVVIQNGELYPGFGVADGRALLNRVFERLVPLADELGVIVSMETARAGSVFNSPAGAAQVVRDLDVPSIRLTPDFESWRLPNPDMPVRYAENPDARMPDPFTLDQFIEYLPLAPYVHAKFLTLQADGSDLNYPMHELFTALAQSRDQHDLCIEYEGWIPDISPEIDPYGQVAKAIAYVERYRSGEKEDALAHPLV